VVKATEAVAGSFHFLDDQVPAFGGSVGGAGVVMVEDLGPPLLEGTAEGLDLGNVVTAAGDDRLVEEGGRILEVFDQVDVSDRFLSVIRPSATRWWEIPWRRFGMSDTCGRRLRCRRFAW